VPWRLHDIRRTVATGMERLGIRLQVVENILGHTKGSKAGVIGIYQRHDFQAEKRAALDLWAHEVERICGLGGIASQSPSAGDTPLQNRPGRTQGPERKIRQEDFNRLKTFPPAVEIKPVNPEWLRAIERAYQTRSTNPLLDCLKRMQTLGPTETSLLKELLEARNFGKFKTGGKPLPFGKKRQFETGAAHIRRLMEDGYSSEEALDRTVKAIPYWFGDDAGAGLASYMKRRGQSRS
jgi:hypothetical protein